MDVPVDTFGGYTPAIPPQNLPPGASPLCQDNIYPLGTVRQRGGLQQQFLLAGLPNVNYLKSYANTTLAQRLLAFDSLGNLYKEAPQGTLTKIFSRPYFGLFSQSVTMFGREYQSFYFNSTATYSAGGFDIPRQFDDTNWDRVSHSGPGFAPAVADLSYNLTALSRTSGVISGTTSGFHGLNPGDLVNITGVADSTFVGKWPVVTVPTASTFTAWGEPGAFAINSMTRAGGTVTAMLGSVPFVTASATIIIAGANNPSFNGVFTAVTVAGNVVTWAQAGSNSTTGGGTLYCQAITVPIVSITNIAPVYDSVVLQLQSGQVNPFPLGSEMTVAGNSDGTFNHTWPVIAAIAQSPAQITANQFPVGIGTGSTDPGGLGGTATLTVADSSPSPTTGLAGPAGSITPGFHQVTVAFINRQGFITMPAVPPTLWAASGGFIAALTNILTGPPNIVARLLLFTPSIAAPAFTGSFYSLPTGSAYFSNVHAATSMLIVDNTTTSLNVDFNDTILQSGFQANYLFTQRTLGETSFTAAYNARIAWLGERNQQQNFTNLGFDGGFPVGFSSNLPAGWTAPSLSGLSPHQPIGLLAGLANGYTPDYGDCIAIKGSGTPGQTLALITQSAVQDYLQVARIAVNTAYRVRARIYGIGLTQGTFHINLQSTIGGFTTAGLAVTAGMLTGVYQEFDFLLTAALASIPSDLTLQLYADGTPTLNGVFVIDSIEIYPAMTPFNYSTAWFSHAFNPESYDNTTSEIQVRPNDGQQLRAAFQLRNNFYLGKDHYLCYVTDDGVNEPSSWGGGVQEVSSTIGICGPNAVDITEEWAVFAERSGVYLIWGSDPIKISQEIEEDAILSGKVCWKSINWSAASTIWVRIDKTNKQILVGAPINGAVTPNVVFMLDYKWLNGAQDIAENPMVTYSAFTGKILAHGRGRRWTYWNITANSMCFAERNDGTSQPFFGDGKSLGKIYQQIDGYLNDDTVSVGSVPINGFWSSYFAPSPMEEQGLQMGAHRKLLGYLKWRAMGVGILAVNVSSPRRTNSLRGYILTANPPGDTGRGIQMHGERFSVQVGTNSLNSYWQLEKLILCMKKDPTIVVAGTNA